MERYWFSRIPDEKSVLWVRQSAALPYPQHTFFIGSIILLSHFMQRIHHPLPATLCHLLEFCFKSAQSQPCPCLSCHHHIGLAQSRNVGRPAQLHRHFHLCHNGFQQFTDLFVTFARRLEEWEAYADKGSTEGQGAGDIQPIAYTTGRDQWQLCETSFDDRDWGGDAPIAVEQSDIHGLHISTRLGASGLHGRHATATGSTYIDSGHTTGAQQECLFPTNTGPRL